MFLVMKDQKNMFQKITRVYFYKKLQVIIYKINLSISAFEM
jgi:hypothetical protein